MRLHRPFGFLAVTLFGLAWAACGSDPVKVAADRTPVEVDCAAPIELQSATLVGFRDRTACAWRGIPFAEPPTGPLRFLPPQALTHNLGTLAVASYRPDCTQSPTFIDPGVSEDCLYLNVYIPGQTADGKRLGSLPVMVFFYGGGFTQGGGSWSFYDGEPFTTHGVILVTVNYRLGPFGYLAPSAVTDADGKPLDGNLGLRDQIASLHWVHDNIATFGGDVNRVTIFGESAGAWSTCALMAAEGTEGLFHRAIMESGECGMGNRAEIAAKADAWIATTGCPLTGPAAMPCLRALDAKTLPDKYGYSMGGGMYPNVDGVVLKGQPLDRMKAGLVKVPLISGFNREETDALRLLPTYGKQENMSFTTFWDLVSQWLDQATVARMRALYPVGQYVDPMALSTAMLDDIVFACPSHDAVDAQKSNGIASWQYRFSPGTGENTIEPFLGSFHGLEVPYVFGNTGGLAFIYSDDAKMKRMREMSARIQRYWTRFAATGDPNGGGDPVWPAFGDSHSRMELTVDPTLTQGLSDDKCAFWSTLAPLGTGERFKFIARLIGFNVI